MAAPSALACPAASGTPGIGARLRTPGLGHQRVAGRTRQGRHARHFAAREKSCVLRAFSRSRPSVPSRDCPSHRARARHNGDALVHRAWREHGRHVSERRVTPRRTYGLCRRRVVNAARERPADEPRSFRMAEDNLLTEYHLTPAGWVQGTDRHFGTVVGRGRVETAGGRGNMGQSYLPALNVVA